jgi:NADH:ubiquinone oxidoreductase subunit F (NADH-binding)
VSAATADAARWRGAPGPGGAGLPRLLPEAGRGRASLTAHLQNFGPAPYRGEPGFLIPEIRAAGLTGRGGAGFPVHRKLEAVAAARRGPAVAVGNGAEGEPASRKDETLLRAAPHLLLDGLQLAAEAVGATRAVLYARAELLATACLEIRLAERQAHGLDRLAVELVAAPAAFLAGQESALADRVSGGPGLPAFTPPPVYERGIDRRPTLVQNVETLAHLALIARFGAAWFRAAGTPEEPGTMLCTLHQANGLVTVGEAELGTALGSLLDLSGASAVLAGGYHGTWIPAARAAGLRLSNASLKQSGARTGAGVLAALPADRCGLAETARVAGYLARESAGQCGPCLSGLPRIAGVLADLAGLSGQRPSSRAAATLSRWADLVEGRGACHHPDGTVRFVRSALRVFAPEMRLHQAGRCGARSRVPFLPAGAAGPAGTQWR